MKTRFGIMVLAVAGFLGSFACVQEALGAAVEAEAGGTATYVEAGRVQSASEASGGSYAESRGVKAGGGKPNDRFLGLVLFYDLRVPQSGWYDLDILYATPIDQDVIRDLHVNGRLSERIDFPATKSGQSFTGLKTKIFMRAGGNTVGIRNTNHSTQSIHIDGIKLGKLSGNPSAKVHQLILTNGNGDKVALVIEDDFDGTVRLRNPETGDYLLGAADSSVRFDPLPTPSAPEARWIIGDMKPIKDAVISWRWPRKVLAAAGSGWKLGIPVSKDKILRSKTIEAGGSPMLNVGTYGEGSVNGTGFRPATLGEQVRLQAEAKPGWTFVRWGGDLTGTENPATFTVHSSAAITAYFAETSKQTGCPLLFEGETYSIYADRVEDRLQGETGRSLDGRQLISNSMVPYGFGQGQKVTQAKPWKLHMGDIWQAHDGLLEWPQVKTGLPVIDAVFLQAIETLDRNRGLQYTRKSLDPLWRAGYWYGIGFGCWMRDSVYIGLLGGHLLDPEGAAATYRFISKNGISNGDDGLVVLPIGIWDYYLTTGDEELMRSVYPACRSRLVKVRWDEKRMLGRFDNYSFVDRKLESQKEEHHEYPFSNNLLLKRAYDVMVRMGKLNDEDPELIKTWEERAAAMKESLRSEYWNEKAGYYAGGPKGTPAYDEAHWENFGISLALWDRFGIYDKERADTILANHDVAWTERGYMEIPRWGSVDQHESHGKANWVWTQIGQYIEAAQQGRTRQFNALFASMIRQPAVDKTFVEYTYLVPGDPWYGRGIHMSGQLWCAMASHSMLMHGMLGMECREDGLYFDHACVPDAFDGMELTGLPYRDAVLDIQVSGSGTRLESILLDGQPVPSIPTNLKGRHSIVLNVAGE